MRSYPQRRDGWLNIGVLHTSLEGNANHAVYAPCSIAELKNFGYDIGRGPCASGCRDRTRSVHVYPGNLPGPQHPRNRREGGNVVSVSDGRIADVQPSTSGQRAGRTWRSTSPPATHSMMWYTHIHARLGEAHAQADGRALAVRITLTGATSLHDRLLAERVALDEQALGHRRTRLRAMLDREDQACELDRHKLLLPI